MMFPNDGPLSRTDIGRRSFLSQAGLGLGAAALASYLQPQTTLAARLPESRGIVSPLHHPPRVKRVIFLYMSGGASHLETFDPKPELKRRSGEGMPESITKGQPIAQLQGKSSLKVLEPLFDLQQCGQSGQQISSVLPHTQKIADDICIVRSMVTEAINHDPAHTFMNTGTTISGRPSMGSWLLYGLGSETENLPGFVVLTSEGGRNPQPISTRMWHSGFLPSKFQGVMFNSKGSPVHYLNRPAGVSAAQQADVIETVRQLQKEQQQRSDDPEIETRVSQYEMAARMQLSVPQLMDVRDESAATLEMYGCQPGDGSFASNCLLARRMAERGVRFIQLYHRDWDHHNDLKKFMGICAGHCDQASAALIQDLKQRDLLKDTLVVWGGEFGRTPMAQDGKGEQLGRDHHMKAFSLWLAGGGIKPGITYGATDDFGYHSVENIVHVHDLHATLLHLLGVDHERLTYFTQGRDFRLTDVKGKVVREILV